jgi:hypothetical protein
MAQQTQSPAPAAAGPVTLDDVFNALGETDPHSTNAGKLRAILGRGGMGTIQKHLDAIRASRAAAQMPQEAGAVPPAPDDAVTAIWTAAYAQAESRVRRRLDFVTADRERLAVLVPALQGDVVALSEAADRASIAADQADQAARASAEAAEKAREQHQALQKALQEAEERHQAEMAQAASAAASAARLAAAEHARALDQVEHDRQTERVALQAAINAGAERLAEALALLHALRPVQAAAGA